MGRNETLLAVAAIVGIVVLEVIALYLHVDGVLLAGSIALIASIATRQIVKANAKKNG